MGVVFAAEDLRLGRRVAIKVLPDEAGADPAAVERFLREARAISSLNHPHICTLHDIGEFEGRHYMHGCPLYFQPVSRHAPPSASVRPTMRPALTPPPT